MVGEETLDIVVYGDAPFDFHLPTNRQQMPAALVRLDPTVRVLYVESPRWIADRWRGTKTPTRPVRYESVGPHLDRVAARLWVHHAEIPEPTRLAYGALWPLTQRVVVRDVRRSAAALGFGSPVLWCYGPAGALLTEELAHRLFVYDVVDDYAVTTHVRRQGDRIRSFDALLTKEADVVFTTSRVLERERAERNPATVFVGNAANTELFGRALGEQPRPTDLGDEPSVVYHGAITDERLDLGLIQAVAEALPDHTFAFLGPSEDAMARSIASIPNARLLGPRPPEALVPYLAHARAGFVPLKDGPHIRSSSSLKIIELLAAGVLPVVPDLECFADAGPEVGRATSAADLADLIRSASTAPTVRQRRADAAAPFSWDEKARRCLEIVRARLLEPA